MSERCPHRPGGRTSDCAVCQPLLGKEAEETRTLYYASGRWSAREKEKATQPKTLIVRHDSDAVCEWTDRHGSD